MAMKRKEIVLWTLVAVALAANIWLPRQMRYKYSWDKDLAQRLATEFCATREDVKEYIQKYVPDVTDEQIDKWTASGELEAMQIGKRTMYFTAAARNLFRINPELAAIKAAADSKDEDLSKSGTSLSGHEAIDAVTIPEIKRQVLENLADGKENPYFALPKRMKVTFTLTVHANTLRPGQTLRCWLPLPRQDVARQTDFKFIEAGANGAAYPMEQLTFSEPSHPHSSVYMEAKTVKNKPTVFHEIFEYTSSGEWHPIDPSKVLAYNVNNPEYKEYTAEREQHVIFTDRLKAAADSVTAGIENPYLQAKAIYTWIDKTFPWASARDYSTIENIPEYVLTNHHGDCGQVTLLFITMCRYKGIPARWQSGLMMHPGAGNLHDWGEVYFEGFGWVPVDQSFGITSYGGDFFLGGIEPYRMVINSDFGGNLDPEKKYPRSDTVDFQRGEVEWDKGNLYFTQWDYDFKIEYLD